MLPKKVILNKHCKRSIETWAYYFTRNKALGRINTLNVSWQKIDTFNSTNLHVENETELPMLLLL